MKDTKYCNSRLAPLALALSLTLACVPLTACGNDSQSKTNDEKPAATDTTDTSTSDTEATDTKPADPKEQFVGEWRMAALEQRGITMSGFHELDETGEKTTLVINTDGTASMALDEESVTFSWALEGDDAIYMTKQSDTEATAQQAILLELKDGALFFPYEYNGEEATLIYTQDGTYAKARQITLDGAKPITSEDELLGTWKLVGFNMGGLSMVGDAEALEAAMYGGDTSITFEKGGTVTMSAGNGAWAIDEDGATLTSESLTGDMTGTVMKQGDELVIDFTAAFGGVEFIEVFAK